MSPLGWATGVYFRNFSKRTYIFEILIFFKYKKEKSARGGGDELGERGGGWAGAAAGSGPGWLG